MKTYHKDKDGNVLMHSDVYLGEDYISNNLKHWKYIKRERKNGRWVYYYEDKEGDKLRDEATRATLDAVFSGVYDRNKTSIDWNKGKIKPYEPIRLQSQKDVNTISNYFKTKKAKESYNKKTFFKRVASYMAVQTLNTASKAIHKGRKWLKKIFG